MKKNKSLETEAILGLKFDEDYTILRSVIFYCCTFNTNENSSENCSTLNIKIDTKFQELKTVIENLKALGFNLLNILKLMGKWENLKNILLFDKMSRSTSTYPSLQMSYMKNMFLRKKLLMPTLNTLKDDPCSSIDTMIEEAIKYNRTEILKNYRDYLCDNIRLDKEVDNKILFALLVFFDETAEKNADINWSLGSQVDEKNSSLVYDKLSSISTENKRELMLYFTKFRKWLVVSTLDTINSTIFDNCILYDLALGSQDPGSDYDISISTKDESSEDIKFCKLVHQTLEELLGGPPGVTLDCNIYLRDFNPTICRIDKENSGSPIMQRNTPSPRKYFQDILIFKDSTIALVKIRMYSKLSEWERFKTRLYLSQVNNEAIGLLLKKSEKTFMNLLKYFFRGLGLEYEDEDFPRFESFFSFLRDHFPALFSNCCKSEYLTRFESIRGLIDEYRKSRKLFLTRDFQYPKADRKMDWLAVKILSKSMKACFFGLEMIFSKGCSTLIGTEQAYNPTDSQIERQSFKRKNCLSSYQILNSVNECYGDFVKDLRNYQRAHPESPGYVVYMSSKYLNRILISAKELFAEKFNRPNILMSTEAENLIIKIKDLSEKVKEQFYQMRKSSSRNWFYALNREKSEASLKLLEEIFGVTDLVLFHKFIEDFVIEINKAANSAHYYKSKFLYLYEKISFSLYYRRDIPLPYQLLRPITFNEKKQYKTLSSYSITSKKHSPLTKLFWQGLLLGIFKNIISFFATYTNFILLPPFVFYDFLRFNFQHSKPGDRAVLDLRASLASLKEKNNSIIEIYQGEFLNYHISYADIYNLTIPKLPLFLRLISDFLIFSLPWISWFIFIVNFCKFKFDLNISGQILNSLRIFSLFNVASIFFVDLILFLLIYQSQKILLPTFMAYDNFAIGLKREFRKNKAKLIADIVGLLMSSIMSYFNILLQISMSEESQSDLLWFVPSIGTGVALFSIKEIALKLRGKY